MFALVALLTAYPTSAAPSVPAAQAVRLLEPSASALRAGPAGIVLDGRLDDPAWAAAPPAQGFKQREPQEGTEATDDTEVRIVYDARTLYIGVTAKDRAPERVVARLLERDRIVDADDGRYRFAGDDAVLILLDPFLDRRNAFVFGTNPNGAEFEALIADESPRLNADWRAVWQVAAARSAEGWTAEFAIPFRSLRYPRAATAWGFNVYRIQQRLKEETLWTGWSRQDGGFHRVSRAGLLEGLVDLPRAGLNLEVKPFGLVGADRDEYYLPTTRRYDLGGDLKWEVHPGLVLDGTVNPDFSQVEADEERVNLTRFSLFYPEKREFFLENAGVFEFGTRSSFDTPPFLMFFSRRIGLDDDENEVPVKGGVRFTGRAGGQTVGFLDVYTGRNPAEAPANHAVARFKRDLGRSGYFGAMVTDKRRSGYSNTAAGLDASLWPTGSLNLQTFVARTETTGPGGDGTAARLGLDYETDRLGVRAQWIHIGPDTDAQMGFITRTDIDRYGGEVRLSRRPSVLGLRRVTLDLFGDYIASVRSGDRLDWYVGPYARVEWNSGETLSAYLQWGESFVDEAFDLADRLAVPVGDYRSDWRSVAFSTSNRRPVRLGVSADWQDGYGGSLSAARAELGASLGSHLSTALSYERSTAELPSGSFVAHLVGTRLAYAFSTRTAASAYLQWNSLEENLVANLRFVYRHRPGSDLILAVNEERGIPGSPWTVAERHLALKVTYLARF